MLEGLIKDSIHKIIRKNNLNEIILGFMDETKDILGFYIIKLKKYLSTSIKYHYTKNYILLIKHLKNDLKVYPKDKFDDILIKLFEIYSIPKKINNLYLIFLLYFYVNNVHISNEKIIFRILYLYYIIILYRNKLDYKLRVNLINIDQIKFNSISGIFLNKISYLYNKFFKITLSKIYYIMFLFLIIIVFFIYFYDFDIFSANILGTNIGNNDVSTFLVNSTLMWAPSMDYINNILKSNSIPYVLLIILAFMLIQTLKDIIKTNIFDLYISYILSIIKNVFKIIFYVYFRFIELFSNKFIMYFINFILIFRLNISFFTIMFFMILYLILHVTIIYFYLFIFNYIFNIGFVNNHILGLSFIISIIIIGFGISKDYLNFEIFMIKINDFIRYIKENKITIE